MHPTFSALWASDPKVILSPPSSKYLLSIPLEGCGCAYVLLRGATFISNACFLFMIVLSTLSIGSLCISYKESEKAFIKRYAESECECMIAVFDGDKVVGNCNLNVKNRKKVRHRAELGIGLRKSHYRLGIGTMLITELSIIARNIGCTQFELTYVDGNCRAKGLYEKCGFVEVGRMPCGVRFEDGTYADDVFMRKVL